QFFYKQGALWQEGTLVSGLESGPWQYYDDLGQLQYVGAFDQGKQIGLWYKYNRQGKKKKWKQFD
ncbi:MAG: toxin-antitoxin system YwqK family antitoxin, partial [Cytophagales bacterium]